MKRQNDIRQRIADAATVVFSKKGFRGATISEIARNAKLGDATIYNHFRNKEDVLLTIPISYTQKFISSAEENLRGIKDPLEKLRKYIWHYLWWSQRNKYFIKVFLLEIRTNLNYYRSEGHNLIKKMVQKPCSILDEGKNTGIFRQDVDSRVFRSFLMGTINHLFLTRLLFNRSFDVLDDFDMLADVIATAVKVSGKDVRPSIEESRPGKKERILRSAETLFAEKMLTDTTIAEIAKSAEVADGTIYEFFGSKEDLLFSIWDDRMKEWNEFVFPERPEMRLRQTIGNIMDWSQRNREWIKIYLKDLVPNPKFYISEHHRLMRAGDNKLCAIFLDGQKKGVFRKDLPVYIFRAMVIGTRDSIQFPWGMLERQHNLFDDTEAFSSLLCRAIKKSKP